MRWKERGRGGWEGKTEGVEDERERVGKRRMRGKDGEVEDERER